MNYVCILQTNTEEWMKRKEPHCWQGPAVAQFVCLFSAVEFRVILQSHRSSEFEVANIASEHVIELVCFSLFFIFPLNLLSTVLDLYVLMYSLMARTTPHIQ